MVAIRKSTDFERQCQLECRPLLHTNRFLVAAFNDSNVGSPGQKLNLVSDRAPMPLPPAIRRPSQSLLPEDRLMID